jgi:hypothetical protein
MPSQFSSKPTFLGLGAAKSATTSIAQLLKQHPEVGFPQNGKKELHFFDYDENDNEDAIRDYLTGFEPNRVVGEFSPSYLFIKTCRDRIFKTLGEQTKFLVVLRDPVDRAYSHYCHAINVWGAEQYRAAGYPIEDLSFVDAIEAEEQRLASGEYHIRHQSYFSKGLYAEQLKWYFDVFPRELFRIGLFEDFTTHPQAFMQDMFQFLGVTESSKPVPGVAERLNFQSNGTVPLEQRAWLVERFLPSIVELEELLGKDLSAWKRVA